MNNKIYQILKWIQLRCLPDSIYTRIIFRKIHGYNLNLANPTTLNEKLHWMKLKGPKFIAPILVDKYLARKYIEEKVGAKYLVPLIDIYDSADDFMEPTGEKLPAIVKTTHDSGIGVIYRQDSNHSIKFVREELKKRLRINHYHSTKEYPYKSLKPRIIAESLLTEKDGGLPNDYKLHFFEGKLEFIYCTIDRKGIDQRHIYDDEWKRQNFVWNKTIDKFDMKSPDLPRPENLNEMISIAEKLAAGFPYIRVDLYNVNGKIYCGELTFFQGSGFDKLSPYEKDLELGEKLDLKKISNIIPYDISKSIIPIYRK
jgi:hypothetical protein